jgi:hypothetical protein
VDVVERFNSFTKRRHDLFNIADLFAVREAEVMLVQTTSGSNVAARIKKIADAEHMPALRRAGVRVVVHGWRKAANGRWALRVVDCS